MEFHVYVFTQITRAPISSIYRLINDLLRNLHCIFLQIDQPSLPIFNNNYMQLFLLRAIMHLLNERLGFAVYDTLEKKIN